MSPLYSLGHLIRHTLVGVLGLALWPVMMATYLTGKKVTVVFNY